MVGILLATGLAASGFGGQAEQRCVAADDFEKDPVVQGWSPHGWGRYGRNLLWSDHEAVSGTHSLSVSPVEELPTGAGWESPPFAVQPGQYYRVSFSAKSAGPFFGAVLFYDSAGALVEGDRQTIVEAGAEWTSCEFMFKTKYPGKTAGVVFYPQRRAPFFVDDWKVQEVTRAKAVAAADRVWEAMPKVESVGPTSNVVRLASAMRKLQSGGRLRVLFLGDSIANDLSNASLDVLLERAFPGARVESEFAGRGGTGYWKLKNQIAQRVVQHEPDLVVLEAISNDPADLGRDLGAIIDGVRKARPETEFLLVTSHLHDIPNATAHGDQTRAALQVLGAEKQVPVVDLLAAWDQYLAQSGKERAYLMRDSLHMNQRGQQVSARALVAWFSAAAR